MNSYRMEFLFQEDGKIYYIDYQVRLEVGCLFNRDFRGGKLGKSLEYYNVDWEWQNCM